MTSALKVIKETPTLRELTTDKLRQAIVSMHFKPNQRLVERDLCEQTGVSRTSVREALRHLEAEGLVERRANKGLYVTVVTPEEARQIYEVRSAIEAAMGRLYAERAGSRDHKALQAALDSIERAISGRPIRSYVEALDAFYEALLQGSGNEVARRILKTLGARITYLRTLTSAKSDQARERETLRLMRGIAEAAIAGDAAETARRCAAFVERSAAFALKVLGEEPAASSEQSGR